MYNSKKILTGAFLALAVTAGATGTALAKENGARADVHADASASGNSRFGNLVSNLRADVKLNAERRQEQRDDRHEDRDERRGDDSRQLIALAIVTSVDGDTIYADSYNGDDKTSWTIVTDADTRFVIRGEKEGDRDVADIESGDRISVSGTVTGNDRTVDATGVVRWDPSKVRANGTVTAIDDDSYTIDTAHQGEVTVDIDSDTQVKGGVLDDIVVGTKVHVKGMWDSVKEAFVAAKVRILG